jgi:glycerol kinase
MLQFVCALDQGTSSTRCIVFSKDGSTMGVSQLEHEQFYPASGMVEHDAEEIWVLLSSAAVCFCLIQKML